MLTRGVEDNGRRRRKKERGGGGEGGGGLSFWPVWKSREKDKLRFTPQTLFKC